MKLPDGFNLRDAWNCDPPGRDRPLYDPELATKDAFARLLAAARAASLAKLRAQRRRRFRYVNRTGWGGKRSGAGRPRKS